MTLFDPALWPASGELRGGGGCGLLCRCPGPAIWGEGERPGRMFQHSPLISLAFFLCGLYLE